jgi:hypothetical protein
MEIVYHIGAIDSPQGKAKHMSEGQAPATSGIPRRALLIAGAAGAAALTVIPRAAMAAPVPSSATSVTAGGPSSVPWWERWPRFAHTRSLQDMLAHNANAMTGWLWEEGRGAYARIADLQNADALAQLHGLLENDIHVLPWLESLGYDRAIVVAVDKQADGSFLIDPLTGNPQRIADTWSWAGSGPGVNSQATFVAWESVFAWMNRETWQGGAVAPAGYPVPRYPDGTPAIGYLDDDSSDPRKSRLWDGLGCKDLNGDFPNGLTFRYGTTAGDNTAGLVPVTNPDGSISYYGDLSNGKDLANDWWVGYNVAAAKYYLQRGIDGFWVDNYNGNDFIGVNPLLVAFGDWSVAGIRKALAQGPRSSRPAGFSATTFDVRQYLKDTLTTWYPGADPTDLGHAGWLDARWTTDPVWSAFRSFKSNAARNAMQKLYDGIKSAALAAGRDPNQVYVSANDIGKLNYAAETGKAVDQVNIEWDPFYHPVLQGNSEGIIPRGQTGSYYRTVSNYGKSRHSVVWFYLWNPQISAFQGNTTVGEMLFYEALANNAILNAGIDETFWAVSPNNALALHNAQERLGTVFGLRRSWGEIGLLFSPNSEYRDLRPGGYSPGGNVVHTLDYYGWSNALIQDSVPFVNVTEFRLEETIQDLKVLIVPNADAIPSAVVRQVIAPWVSRGGTLVVTGADSGRYAGVDEAFADRGSAVLADLARRPRGSGHGVYLDGRPGMDYYATGRSSADRAGIAAVVRSLRAAGRFRLDVALSGFGQVVATVNRSDASERPAVFIDLVNQQLTLDQPTATATLAPLASGTVTLTQPAAGAVTVRRAQWHDVDGSAPVSLPITRIGANAVQVAVPAFRAYGSIVLS